jgi:hypothetical protein
VLHLKEQLAMSKSERSVHELEQGEMRAVDLPTLPHFVFAFHLNAPNSTLIFVSSQL